MLRKPLKRKIWQTVEIFSKFLIILYCIRELIHYTLNNLATFQTRISFRILIFLYSILEFLLTNEYLIPCSQYIIPKLLVKRKYNHERTLLLKANKILKKSEKTEACMNDINVAADETYNLIKKGNTYSKNLILI